VDVERGVLAAQRHPQSEVVVFVFVCLQAHARHELIRVLREVRTIVDAIVAAWRNISPCTGGRRCERRDERGESEKLLHRLYSAIGMQIEGLPGSMAQAPAFQTVIDIRSQIAVAVP